MKTLRVNDLLIVEIPRLSGYEFINRDSKYLKIGNEEIKLGNTLNKWELICKGSELTEEIASTLVDEVGGGHILYSGNWYKNYKDDDSVFEYPSESFQSLIESKGFYWGENPYKDVGLIPCAEQMLYRNAKEKTFNLDQTLIFKIV